MADRINPQDNTPENIRSHNEAFLELREKRHELREKILNGREALDTKEKLVYDTFRDLREQGSRVNTATLDDGTEVNLKDTRTIQRGGKERVWKDVIAVLRNDWELRQTDTQLKALGEQAEGLMATTLKDRETAIVDPIGGGKAAQEIQNHKDKAEGILLRTNDAINAAEKQNTVHHEELKEFADQKVVSRADITAHNQRAADVDQALKDIKTKILTSPKQVDDLLAQRDVLVDEKQALAAKSKEDAAHLEQTEVEMKQAGRRVAALGEADVKINGDSTVGFEGMKYGPKAEIDKAVEQVRSEAPVSAFYDTQNVRKDDKIAAEKAAAEKIAAEKALESAKAAALTVARETYTDKLIEAERYFATDAGKAYLASENSKDFKEEFQQALADNTKLGEYLRANSQRGLAESILGREEVQALEIENNKIRAAQKGFAAMDKDTLQCVQVMTRCGVQYQQVRTAKDGIIDVNELRSMNPDQLKAMLDVDGKEGVSRHDLERIYKGFTDKGQRDQAVDYLAQNLAAAGIQVKDDRAQLPTGDLKPSAARDANAAKPTGQAL